MKFQTKEIIWNLVNAGLAGVLVLLGAFTTGNINPESISVAVVAALIVTITQFKDYWLSEKPEYSVKLFKFV